MNNVDNTYEIMGRNAGIMWYNGLESGPCGEAELTVDYFCPKTLIKDKKVSLTYKIGLLAYISAHYDDGRGKIYIS